jgi:pimeloyl-ACP methyl ester carboxylesterase
MTSSDARFLDRPDGRVAYDVDGATDGPVVVLVPGMGDLRSTYRLLAPLLVAAGYQVVTTDLRGHGDSDVTFTRYGDAATGSDLLALVEELGRPAVLVGNSMGAGAAVWAAAERPELVRGLVLIGPFVRDGDVSAAQRLLLRVAMMPLWAAAAWKAYLPTLYAGHRPEDFEAHRARVAASLRRPGYTAAFVRTTRISHAEAAAQLPGVKAPALVVMGVLDPDFRSPADEAGWIAEQLGAEAVLVPDAGHYPQSQQPHRTAEAVLAFLAGLATATGGTGRA